MSLKQSIQKLFFPVGSEHKIKLGYLRNNRIKISHNTQWAPLFGRWEPAMQKIIANTVKENDTVYDLGANFGLHGMLFSRLIGPGGFLYNFEPLPANQNEIEVNYKLNNISNFRNIQKAVSNQNSILKFSVGEHATQGKVVK